MTDTQTHHKLGAHSEEGIYECQRSKVLFWKVNQHEAVALSEVGLVPQFGVVDLPLSPIDWIWWGGPVYPRIRGGEFGNVVGRSGLLVRKGLRLYLRANAESGHAHNMMVEGTVFDSACRFTEHYVEWDLVRIYEGQEMTLFSAPKLFPKLRVFEEESDDEEQYPWHWTRVMG